MIIINEMGNDLELKFFFFTLAIFDNLYIYFGDRLCRNLPSVNS